jgi:hypothetical protein
MKLQRYSWDSVYEDFDQETKWVKASDAEALELAVERATANMVAAQNRVAELEKALREIVRIGELLNNGPIIFTAEKALEAKG